MRSHARTVFFIFVCISVLFFLSNMKSQLLLKVSGANFNDSIIDRCYLVEKTSIWPNLELFLPVASLHHIWELRVFFLQSYALFWPLKRSNTSLLLLVDEEVRGKLEVAMISNATKEMLGNSTTYSITYNSMPPAYAGMSGHSRQQWLMFWAENFTQAKFVGFVDTDTIFVTQVILNDLFDVTTMRPIIRGLYGMPQQPSWGEVPLSTYYAIGRKSPLWCMSYFPVIIKVPHLAEMREHIRKQMKMATFDDAFRNFSRMSYSQFDIMCAYLWYFKHDDYVWAIGQRDHSWQGPIPAGQVENMQEAGITAADRQRHGPRVAAHKAYSEFNEMLKTGVCYSMLPNNPLFPNYCKSVSGIRMHSICEDQWAFEGHFNFHNLTFAIDKHRERLQLTDACPHEWNRKLIPKRKHSVFRE